MKLKSLVFSISAVLLSGCGVATEKQKYNADVIINNGQILTVNSAMKVIDYGVVVIKNDLLITPAYAPQQFIR
ncbi:hypothetical protein BTO22_05920 [Aliivibrio sifiae]|uniref:Amidohydrolase n=1 Tax=Aliivibrio sifiae TaxID=566293 RepID=A0A2S7XD33_9GAMM|nr:hypothetical protein BTO22_05920 [Aliivibrio sifiae]